MASLCDLFSWMGFIAFVIYGVIPIVFVYIDRAIDWVKDTHELHQHMRRRLIEMEFEIDMMRAEVWRNDKTRSKFASTFA